MATSLVPLITSAALNYNPNMAETYSWVPMSNNERPLFAKAVYPVQNMAGVTVGTNGNAYFGDWRSILCAGATTFSALTALNSDGSLTGTSFPAGTVLEVPIKGFAISAGGPVVAQKA
jgi:hypothetical protein